MDAKRQGEIALTLVRTYLRKRGINLLHNKQGLGDIATATGIPVEEVKTFAKLMINEHVEEFFSSEKK